MGPGMLSMNWIELNFNWGITIKENFLTNMASLSMGIDKLKRRENFKDWKFSVENYLIDLDLWELDLWNQGTEKDPKKIARARSKIILLIEPLNFVHIKTAATAKEVWDRLCSAFSDKVLTRRVGLLKSL